MADSVSTARQTALAGVAAGVHERSRHPSEQRRVATPGEGSLSDCVMLCGSG